MGKSLPDKAAGSEKTLVMDDDLADLQSGELEPLDLESAYRQALQAVSGTDSLEFDRWTASSDEANESGVADAPESATPPVPATGGRSRADVSSERVTPRQILEAALFVGGIELSADRLAGLLKGEYNAKSVARLIEGLNKRYEREQRPYLVVQEENLFRLALREEFEPLRRRVYGLGPKEVKLTQDALEILALVAYRQPISREGIESLREGNAGNVLRQLVRRQLIAVERQAEEAAYVTTRRFLDVFGLASLEEMPRAERLEFK